MENTLLTPCSISSLFRAAIVSLCGIACFTMSAQQWAPLGAEWRHRSEFGPTGLTTYDLIRIEKDTVLDGQACRKYLVYAQPVGEERNLLQGSGFTYARNDSVFFWLGDRFGLRYDFSAEPGDTITFFHPAPEVVEGFPPEADSSRVILERIATVEAGTPPAPLTKYHTRHLDGPFDYLDGGYVRTIGNLHHWQGLQYVGEMPTVGAFIERLRCYTDSVQTIYLTDLSCSFPTTATQPPLAGEVMVYPNPVRRAAVYVQLGAHTLVAWQLYELTGGCGSPERGTWREHCEINIGDRPSGYYLLRLQLQNGSELVKPLVISLR
jgi:hypothetical protein